MHPRQILISVSAIIYATFLASLPAHAQCAMPNTIVNGQPADVTKVMANLTALTNCLTLNSASGLTFSLQFNSGGSTFGGLGPLTNGQLAIGSTGNSPQAATLTAGTNVAITNDPGGITISSTIAGSGGSWPPFVPPHVADFPINLNDGTPLTASDDADVGLTYSVSGQPSGDRIRLKGQLLASGTDFTVTAHMNITQTPYNYTVVGLSIWSAGQAYASVFGLNQASSITIVRYNQSGTGALDTVTVQQYARAFPWFRISYVSTSDSLSFFNSDDGKTWVTLYTTTGSSLLGAAPTHIGFGVAPNNTGTQGGSIDYWVQN